MTEKVILFVLALAFYIAVMLWFLRDGKRR